METKQIAIGPFLISTIVVLSIEGACRWALPYHPLILVGVARLLEAILIGLILGFWGGGLSTIGLDPSRWLQGIKKGLIWSAAFALLSALIFVGFLLADTNLLALFKTRLPLKPVDVGLFFVVGGIMAPVTEELFFRGLIYGFLRRWGFPAALIVSTLLFVVAHPLNHAIPLTQVAGGLLFAIAYEVEGNLLVPITIHMLGNLAIFTLSLSV